MKKFLFNMDEELLTSIKKYAKKTKMTLAELIRNAIQYYLKRKK